MVRVAAIADVYVDVIPTTAKVASGIEKALRKVDAAKIGREYARQIERGLGDIEVELKVDSAKAKAEIEKATKDQKVEIKASADTAKADAEIDHAARDRHSTIHVGIDKDRLGAMGADMFSTAAVAGMKAGAAGATSALQELSGAFRAVSSGGEGTIAMYAAMTPALAALAGVAAAAAGAVALLPAAFAAAGAGAGVLMVGLSGIKDAYEAVSGASKDAGKDAQEHASKVQSASRSVTSAQQSLTSAVRSERQAQQDVARARRDALHELQDINDELRNGAIDETQAQLDLAQARERLATGTFDSSLDYQQAQLDVIKNEQRLKEAHEQNAEAMQNAADKQAKGVEGADAVVAAEQRLADAQQATANAQTALADAQTKLAEANNEVSTSAQKAADAMGGLSPNAQSLVNTLVGLQPVWEQFRNSLQDPLTANLGPALTNTINAVLPAIQPGLIRISEAFNSMAQGVGDWLQNPENLAMISHIVNNIAAAFEQLKPAVQPFMTAMATLTSAGSDFLPGFAHAIADAATSFSNFITEAQKSGDLQQFIMRAVFAFQELGKLMPDVLWLFGKFSDLGVQALPGIVDVLRAIIRVTGYLIPAFAAPFDLIHKLVTGVGDAIDWVEQTVKKIPGWWKSAWDAAGRIVSGAWNSYFRPFFQRMFDGVNLIIKGLNLLPGVDIPEIDLPTWYVQESSSGDGKSGAKVPKTGGDDKTPTPKTPGDTGDDKGKGKGKGTPKTPGDTSALPAPSSSTGDGTRVFVTNWPSGSGTPSVAGPPGSNGSSSGGGVPVIPDPNRPGFFTSSNPEWAKLIKRESGGAPSVTQTVHDQNWPNNKASGLFQITKSTWEANGGTEFAPTAGEATPQEQGIVAARIIAKNPSGSDWGAGPGRENAAALLAGVTPPSPAPPGGPTPTTPGQTPVASVPFGLRTPEELQQQPWVKQLEAQTGLTAETRKGHQTTNRQEAGFAPNPQNLIRGIDWSGSPSQMDAFADQLIAHPEQLEQMIYWSPLTGKKYCVAGGKVVDPSYYADDLPGHRNHIHTRSSHSFSPSGSTDSTTTIPSDSTNTIPLNPNVPADQQGSKDKGKDYGKDLGQNIMSGMMEVLGIGELWPDPTQFGLFKIFKSIMQIKPGKKKSADGTTTDDTSSSGSGSIFDLLGSLIPGVGDNSIAAWVPPGGNTAGGNIPSLADDLADMIAGPGGNTVNNVVNVEGNIDNPTLNKVDTQHISDLRNIGK